MEGNETEMNMIIRSEHFISMTRKHPIIRPIFMKRDGTRSTEINESEEQMGGKRIMNCRVLKTLLKTLRRGRSLEEQVLLTILQPNGSYTID